MTQPDLASLDDIVRLIQASLSPIFLLTAIAGLLGVFTSRLARIADQADKLARETDEDDAPSHRQLQRLKLRSHALDVAVALAAGAGACTCGTVLALFLGLVRAKATSTLLLVLFGTAIICTIAAIAAFLVEMLLATQSVRANVARSTASLKAKPDEVSRVAAAPRTGS